MFENFIQYILILSTPLFLLLHFKFYIFVCMYMACVHAFLYHVSERTSEEGNSEVDFPSFLRIKLRLVQQKHLYPLSHLPIYCLPGHS